MLLLDIAAETETLFSAVGATNRSAILSSVFKCQEQEVSEAVLALWMLIKHGRMSDDDVDKCAEAYMQIKFQVNMDFEVDDALDKLVTLELIEKKEDGRYKAKSPTYLLEVMAERWLEVDLGLANGGGGVVGGVSAVAGGVGSAAMSGAKVLNKINPLKNLF
ncbi:hypothetical protein SARC_05451 [Sphaeroforma arctica JP610]|uniref:Uncharacterized protein n=1 Tax=Sphaeroforma arctica JP610 TaxID=667725 RepID=A0A0L0G0A1_9EUKA|nr:hypothetical protein SARC_05451 [Sphaeroforma arctica JP610]KNC82261.1 hypothetical protein SARC_05451 [Sphaeroforma arctica JP610]|eukprot:XP_014156163.1 hypothetical protein SARC_05451 [Sphaeroforma arctica JP610]